MIKCIINGREGFPSLQSEIKLTKENPYVTKGDSFTMDINFPMDIPENAEIFGSIHRMDVSKRNTSFSDCSLYVDNLLITRGSGRITEITETTVKLQILGGNSNVKYKAGFQKVFIDRITYPQVAAKYVPSTLDGLDNSKSVIVDSEIQSKGYVGDITQYVFMPTYDIDNDCIANCCSKYTNNDTGVVHEILYNSAVQPNLMMVLQYVMQSVGYTVRNNVYDQAPWNKLIIANARQTLNIAYALPHWTVETFIDEFRKLFNASFVFDDAQKTVDIVRNNELDTTNDVSYDVVAEYKTNYDEDGIDYIGGSNIKYDLQGSDRSVDDYPQEVKRSFSVLEYVSYSALEQAFQGMSESDKFTHVFHCPRGYFFYGHEYNAEGEDTEQYILKQFGIFSPLYRDDESEDFTELKLYPAEMRKDKYNFKEFDKTYLPGVGWVLAKSDKFGYVTLPNVQNEDGNSLIDYDEKGYVSVSNVLEDGDNSEKEEEEETTGIPLMWVEGVARPIDNSEHHYHDVPMSFTDMRVSYMARLAYSMCLIDPYLAEHYIGALHRGSVQIESTVDGNTEVCYQFLMDGLPDPTKIYVFRNKRYLCSKIEVKITEDGIDKLKTGYFHEVKL